MSSKRSDPSLAPDLGDLAPTGWRQAIVSNAALPILLLLLIPLGAVLDNRRLTPPFYTRIITLVGYNLILAVSLQLINGFSGQFSLGHAGFMAVGAFLSGYAAKAYADPRNHLADPTSTLLFFVALGITVAVTGGTIGALFLLLRQSRRIARAAPAALMLVCIVWLLIDIAASGRQPEGAALPPYLIWSRAIVAVGSMFEGIISTIGPAARHITAILPETLRPPLTFIVLLLGGGATAAAAGLIVGLPTLRLRGDYLAIATLGMAEIIRIIIMNSRPLGGALGLTGVPRYTNTAWLYGAVLVTIVVIWRIAYSAKGRAIQAVREDEIAAAAVGVDPTRQKVITFAVGAFFAGVAGALFALNESSVTPSRFTLDRSIEVVAIVTLGGLGSISGAILATIILTLLPEVLRFGWIAELRMVIYSALLVVMMLVRPQGLIGGRELWPKAGWLGRRRSSAPPTMDPPSPPNPGSVEANGGM